LRERDFSEISLSQSTISSHLFDDWLSGFVI